MFHSVNNFIVQRRYTQINLIICIDSVFMSWFFLFHLILKQVFGTAGSEFHNLWLFKFLWILAMQFLELVFLFCTSSLISVGRDSAIASNLLTPSGQILKNPKCSETSLSDVFLCTVSTFSPKRATYQSYPSLWRKDSLENFIMHFCAKFWAQGPN